MKTQIFKRKSREYRIFFGIHFSFFIILSCLLGLAPVRADETASSTIDDIATTTVEITSSTPGISASTADNTATTTLESATTTPETAAASSTIVNLNLRYQNSLIYSGQIAIPSSTDIIDSSGISHFTASSNVLTALIAADAASSDFGIANLQYYADWSSFYLKCVNIATPTAASLCDNWNYVVNGNYPNVGMDNYILTGGENIYIYFNNPWQITVSSSTFPAGITTTFYTWRSNYDNLAEEWMADPNDLIDISIPNPSSTGWWDAALTVTTTTSNASGTVDYMFASSGTYYAKITSVDWTKWTFPITITVIDASNNTPPEIPPPSDKNAQVGVSGGSSPIVHQSVNIQKAVDFLSQRQNIDGSFGSGIYTDWAAMALVSVSADCPARDKVKEYLLTNPDPLVGLNAASDYARRAMALMSLNINPRTGTATNYVQKIMDSYTDGQFGDTNLFNDDIFALFPLLKAGYAVNDPEIASSTNFILTKQNINGSWDGVDLTAAAIQSLSPLTTIGGVSEAVGKAKQYLHEQQQGDGGFGNSFSTSWVLQAIAAIGESETNWMKNNKTPNDYLYSLQSGDGGLDVSTPTSTRIWATSYAIPAALGKTWNQMLRGFERPAAQSNAGGIGGSPELITATTTTSTQIAQPMFAATATGTTALLTTSATAALESKNATTSTIGKTKLVTQKDKLYAASSNKKTSNTAKKQLSRAASAPSTQGLRRDNKTIEQLNNQMKETVSAVNKPVSDKKIEQIIERIPLDSPTRRTAKKVLAVSGGGAIALGLYLGLKFLKNVV